MVGQEAGSGLWSGVSGVPGKLSLFRKILPKSFFLSFALEVLNTTFLGFIFLPESFLSFVLEV